MSDCVYFSKIDGKSETEVVSKQECVSANDDSL
jgi:hypothetical protein